MNASTEELLYILLWTADTLLHPTWRNANDSFETWGWRNGMGRRIAELQRQQLVERAPADVPHAFVRLTHAGRLCAIGGRDPDEQWRRPWDGQWRMVLFDIPVEQHRLRMRLWRNLRRQGFGYLQNSVWITPDPIDRARLAQAAELPSVEMIIVIQGRPCAGETDPAIVDGAWDFADINRGYEHCVEVLKRAPRSTADFQAVREWSRAERLAWAQAVRHDPFLPAELLPSAYLGRTAWQQRKATLAQVARDRGFVGA